MATVTNVVLRADATPAAKAAVTIRLAGNGGAPLVGYLEDGSGTIIAPAHLEADDDGAWSVELVANSAILPAGSVYLVAERAQGEEPAESYIVVPAGPGPFALEDLLSGPPGDLDPIAGPPGPPGVSAALAIGAPVAGATATTLLSTRAPEVGEGDEPVLRDARLESVDLAFAAGPGASIDVQALRSHLEAMAGAPAVAWFDLSAVGFPVGGAGILLEEAGAYFVLDAPHLSPFVAYMVGGFGPDTSHRIVFAPGSNALGGPAVLTMLGDVTDFAGTARATFGIPVEGVAPALPEHLTTKGYVDDAIAAIPDPGDPGAGMPASLLARAPGWWCPPATWSGYSEVHEPTTLTLAQMFPVSDPTESFDRLGVVVDEAGSPDGTIRLGVAADDGGRPGTILVQDAVSGDVAGSRAIVLDDWTPPEAGLYWLVERFEDFTDLPAVHHFSDLNGHGVWSQARPTQPGTGSVAGNCSQAVIFIDGFDGSGPWSAATPLWTQGGLDSLNNFDTPLASLRRSPA